ncbi:unnamed protein product [Brassicogethes aeneus]|uniref:tRNA (uracil-O(2)-)-methyltransferase n=1 Tax=Brassicogethes aeneus TaxID=1431903 RepID=A0A9P0B439_BRAAE|nr:unnamed protein product [Brassicogethes aeneus]
MQQIPLAQSSTSLSVEKFWETLLIYHDRPHLVNRKLLAVSQALFCEVIINTNGISKVKDLFTRAAVLYEARKLSELNKDSITVDFIRNIVECYDKHVVINEKDKSDFISATTGVFISVRVLLGRNNNGKCVEVVVLDKDNSVATFLCAFEFDSTPLAPPFPYEIDLINSLNLRITVESFEDADTNHAQWLGDKLFSKLIKWSESELNENTVQSLNLISPDDYCLLYSDLKHKYGDDLVKKWPSKATTDPQKFVFEDIAIAAYLICIWSKYTNKNYVNFVDCGCGNGLLVFILNSEGFKGYGIDIRRRPTWDLYPQTDLREGTISPDSLFTDCSWLIGNHSDELTPWIPVMSLKSSPKTNFFVLPCCSYDFSGKKFVRKNTSISQYCDYMNYIEGVCKKCNFTTKVDKLRIPSTKRTCFVGLQNIYHGNEDYLRIVGDVVSFVDEKLTKNQFTARIESSKARNCTQLDKQLLDRIINICISNILSEENFIVKDDGEKWNKGTNTDFQKLSTIIPIEDKKQLKNECGGLQTLLRNHRYLFEMKKNKIYLREPLKLDSNTEKYKNKPCWFLENHPQGCLYNSITCAYNHDK